MDGGVPRHALQTGGQLPPDGGTADADQEPGVGIFFVVIHRTQQIDAVGTGGGGGIVKEA